MIDPSELKFAKSVEEFVPGQVLRAEFRGINVWTKAFKWDPAKRTRLELIKELEHLCNLTHPNLSGAHHILEYPEFLLHVIHYDPLEYVTLDQILVQLQAKQRKGLLTGLSLGLRYLHSRNIYHGNLGLSEIYVNLKQVERNGEGVKIAGLLDHRIRASIASSFDDFLRVSNYQYYNTAILQSKRSNFAFSSPAGDVFAFGMIIWSILTRAKPYQNVMVNDVITAIERGDILNLTPLNTQDQVFFDLYNLCCVETSRVMTIHEVYQRLNPEGALTSMLVCVHTPSIFV